MIRIYWLEQTEADVATGPEWMNDDEMAYLATLRFPKRRADWRLGRWTAKRAIAAFFGLRPTAGVLAGITIRAAASGAPQAFGAPAPVSISITHRDSRSICALTPAPATVGCDLELIEVRSVGFIEDYFTEQERASIWSVQPPERFRLATLLWSAKESALKVSGLGLRADTRSASVHLAAASDAAKDWTPLKVVRTGEGELAGWCCADGCYVRTIVANFESLSPERLDISAASRDNDLTLTALR